MRATLGILILLLPVSALATIHQVPGDFATITDALAAASSGDVVQVAAGTYAPSTNGESFPLSITIDDIQLMGAGMGVSILDAEGSAGVIFIDVAGTGRVNGFTVTGGVSTWGGGLDLRQGTHEIDHNYFWNNAAVDRGSGINVAGSGNPWIHHNVLWENVETVVGVGPDPHGIQLGQNSTGLVEYNLVGRHDSNGLIIQELSEPTVRGNIFYQNGNGSRGRGICALGSPDSIINHNVFWQNSIAAFIITGEGNMNAANANDLDANDDIYGNVDGDPLLTDPDQEDYSLQWTSAAIDAGDPASPLDPDGTVADAGPFFFDQSATATPRARSSQVAMLPNVPNPFNPATTVRFRLERAAEVTVEILDARGRRVRLLFEGVRPEGESRALWDGRDDRGAPASSGVYLATVRTREVRSSLPVVLVR